MSRKDYRAIAEAIREAESLPDVVAKIATALKADNYRFDRARFTRACGK